MLVVEIHHCLDDDLETYYSTRALRSLFFIYVTLWYNEEMPPRNWGIFKLLSIDYCSLEGIKTAAVANGHHGIHGIPEAAALICHIKPTLRVAATIVCSIQAAGVWNVWPIDNWGKSALSPVNEAISAEWWPGTRNQTRDTTRAHPRRALSQLGWPVPHAKNQLDHKLIKTSKNHRHFFNLTKTPCPFFRFKISITP